MGLNYCVTVVDTRCVLHWVSTGWVGPGMHSCTAHGRSVAEHAVAWPWVATWCVAVARCWLLVGLLWEVAVWLHATLAYARGRDLVLGTVIQCLSWLTYTSNVLVLQNI